MLKKNLGQQERVQKMAFVKRILIEQRGEKNYREKQPKTKAKRNLN